jgi:hypothetical protein
MDIIEIMAKAYCNADTEDWPHEVDQWTCFQETNPEYVELVRGGMRAVLEALADAGITFPDETDDEAANDPAAFRKAQEKLRGILGSKSTNATLKRYTVKTV